MLRFFFLLIPTLSLVLYGFLTAMRHLERDWILKDLEQRSALVADTLGVSLDELVRAKRTRVIQDLLDRTGSGSRLIGASVCSPDGRLIAKSETVPTEVACAPAAGADNLLPFRGSVLHVSRHKLMHGPRNTAVLQVFQNSSHLQVRTEATQRYILFAFLGIGLLVSLVTFAVYRWTVHGPLHQLTTSLKLIAAGRTKFAKRFEHTDFGPFARNLEQVLRDLRRTESNDTSANGVWTAPRLREETKRLFGDAKICVVANREPYIHNRRGSKIEVQFPSSGLVSAVEPILRACSGLWIGHGSGSADRETSDRRGVLLVPPGNPEYALKRVWLSKEEEQGYYYGFANEGIWPLCHIAHTRPVFRSADWEQYQAVNRKFARAFESEMGGAKSIALIQDYHFALLPGILREMNPSAVSSLFWHIPWPNPEAIAICPWKNQIMSGMLGADLIGFHTQYHCNNFLDSVDRFMEARVDRENFSVTIKGHTCFVKPFPISIEWPPRNDALPDEIPEVRSKLLEELGLRKDALVGVGIDRLDYTKGIIERFLSIERLLEKHPELIGRFVFIQIGAPSRTQIKRYQDFNGEVQE
ncbi:MAG: trehalose-6-phosphate synthase, partial [Bdellovibrionia bacterium]